MTAFCGICTADIPSTARLRYFDGARVCDACCDEPIDATTPEQRQRGYVGDSSIAGISFSRDVTLAARRLLPRRLKKLARDTAFEIPRGRKDGLK